MKSPSLHNPDLFLRQPVQPGPRRSARPWPRSGRLQGGLLVGRAGFRDLFMESEHLLHQGDHAKIVAGDVFGITK